MEKEMRFDILATKIVGYILDEPIYNDIKDVAFSDLLASVQRRVKDMNIGDIKNIRKLQVKRIA